MIIKAYPFPSAYKEKRYNDKTVVVVDILRATTSILEALLNGANQVIPAKGPEEVRMLASNWGRDGVVMSGEQNGLRLSGYDIGNSPLEFSKDCVYEKTIVMCTSNGTDAILDSRTANKILIGSLRNRTAVAAAALQTNNNIILHCAGTEGECSADDIICVGGILEAMHTFTGGAYECNDFALVCLSMYRDWKKGEFPLSSIHHYQRLQELGFEEDLRFCFMEDVTDRVPLYENGSIRLI